MRRSTTARPVTHDVQNDFGQTQLEGSPAGLELLSAAMSREVQSRTSPPIERISLYVFPFFFLPFFFGLFSGGPGGPGLPSFFLPFFILSVSGEPSGRGVRGRSVLLGGPGGDRAQAPCTRELHSTLRHHTRKRQRHLRHTHEHHALWDCSVPINVSLRIMTISITVFAHILELTYVCFCFCS